MQREETTTINVTKTTCFIVRSNFLVASLLVVVVQTRQTNKLNVIYTKSMIISLANARDLKFFKRLQKRQTRVESKLISENSSSNVRTKCSSNETTRRKKKMIARARRTLRKIKKIIRKTRKSRRTTKKRFAFFSKNCIVRSSRIFEWETSTSSHIWLINFDSLVITWTSSRDASLESKKKCYTQINVKRQLCAWRTTISLL